MQRSEGVHSSHQVERLLIVLPSFERVFSFCYFGVPRDPDRESA
jgi:hypothetical protein